MNDKDTILIAGGNGGLGKAAAWYLQTQYNWVNPDSGDMDIRNQEEVEGWVRVHKPDILLNFAGINIDNLIAKTSREEVNEQIEVNIIGNVNLIRAFSSHCRLHEKKGRYVYISSILSSRPVKGAGVYSACKAFNDNLIKTAAIENAKYNITFNSIQLGYFGEGMCERLPRGVKEKVLNKIPLRRFGNPKELVNLLDFFIKTEYATGMCVPLTGGLDV